MDLYCGNCGEPSEVCHVEHGMEPRFRKMFKAGQGCDCCEGKKQEKKPLRAVASAELMELLGDDLDGVAGMLDDFDGSLNDME
jgi:hypothetical protein